MPQKLVEEIRVSDALIYRVKFCGGNICMVPLWIWAGPADLSPSTLTMAAATGMVTEPLNQMYLFTS